MHLQGRTFDISGTDSVEIVGAVENGGFFRELAIHIGQTSQAPDGMNRILSKSSFVVDNQIIDSIPEGK